MQSVDAGVLCFSINRFGRRGGPTVRVSNLFIMVAEHNGELPYREYP